MDTFPDRGAVSTGTVKTLYWEAHQVRALVTLWTDESVQQQLRTFRRNELVYCNLSDELAKIGIQKTAQQCREKLKRMKQEYRRIKSHNMQNGADFKTSEYYDVFDAMLGNWPEGRIIPQPGTSADSQSAEGKTFYNRLVLCYHKVYQPSSTVISV
uniref:Myb/SANT-like DNA-binding domain-containing protein n=1 Tax=Eptatretus burgeri TaxID=7764 RepID=A0A8C4NC15_EPTBU